MNGSLEKARRDMRRERRSFWRERGRDAVLDWRMRL
jgi:hypothetical protein